MLKKMVCIVISAFERLPEFTELQSQGQRWCCPRFSGVGTNCRLHGAQNHIADAHMTRELRIDDR
jgi:hypothetical protein